MDLVQMRFFLAVAKYLSFTKASEHLYTSQSAVSKRIALLEDELGVKLFIRTKQYVYLTPAGKLLYNDFEDIVKRIDNALENVKKASQGIMGELHVGFHGLMDINRIIPDFFSTFPETYPNIKLVIESYSFKELRDCLLNGTLDLIFTFSFEQQGNPSIQRLMLSRTNSRVYYSRLLPVLSHHPVSEFSDFKDDNLILLQNAESSDASQFVLKIYERYGFPKPKILQVNSMETMLFYLESGAGIALLGSSYRLNFSEKICSVELKDKEAMVGSDALWRRDNPNPSLNVFTKALAEHSRHQH